MKLGFLLSVFEPRRRKRRTKKGLRSVQIAALRVIGFRECYHSLVTMSEMVRPWMLLRISQVHGLPPPELIR